MAIAVYGGDDRPRRRKLVLLGVIALSRENDVIRTRPARPFRALSHGTLYII